METVLITGANRGIGLEFTRQYLAKDWQVIACCRQPEATADLQELLHHNSQLKLIQMDVADEASVKRASRECPDDVLDVLINNAGTGADEQGISTLDFENMLKVFKTNAIGPLCVVKAFLPQLQKSKNAVITNIISGTGFLRKGKKLANKNQYSYGASKAALNHFTKYLAGDLQDNHIAVVGLGPGYVLTDMTSGGAWSPKLRPQDTVPLMIDFLAKVKLENSGELFDYDEHAAKIVVANY